MRIGYARVSTTAQNLDMQIAQIMESLGVKSNRTIYKYLQQKGIKANRK